MSTSYIEPLILAIGSQDDFLHVYQNDEELLADDSIGVELGKFSDALEFFDSEGHRLAGVYNRQWQLLRLTPTTSEPDLSALLQRVQNTINHLVRSFSKDNPEASAEFDPAVKEGLAQLPHLRTPEELREFLQNFFARHVTPVRIGLGGPESGTWKQIVRH